MKTIASVVIIALLVFLFTGCSPWLTLCTILILVGSIIDNLFLYYIVFGIDKVGMLNAASGMILVSIGVDDVLVYINIFRGQSADLDQVSKVAKTMQSAATSTFFTSATTALAFAGNIVSPMPAVKSFGLFMSCLVLVCWFLVALVMPPALAIWKQHLPKAKPFVTLKTKTVCNKIPFCGKSQEAKVEPVKSLRDQEQNNPKRKQKSWVKNCASVWRTCNSKSRKNVLSLIEKMTKLIIKIRWLLIILWAVVMGAAIFGLTRVDVSSDIPKVFSGQNRIEEALLLRQQNAYVADHDCVTCSPIYINSNDFVDEHFNSTESEKRVMDSRYDKRLVFLLAIISLSILREIHFGSRTNIVKSSVMFHADLNEY